MSLAIRIDSLLSPPERPTGSLQVTLARRADDIEAAQRLRYRVFVDEMGARVDCKRPQLESDRFDMFCHHLVVIDRTNSQVVGCYRILTDEGARDAGGFYAQTEFDLTRILALPGRFMEVGRTCVHPDYRNGPTLALLWRGLVRFMLAGRYDYMMGCASVPMHAAGICHSLINSHRSPEGCRVYPRIQLPKSVSPPTTDVAAPALLRSYLRAGARICGEPAWDPFFNVADLFLLLRRTDLHPRYTRHFIGQA